MKLKYYLRGLAIGIMITTIILMIGYARNKNTLSDDEIIARAKQLGMIMPDEQENGAGPTDTQSEDTQQPDDGDVSRGEQEGGAAGNSQGEDTQEPENGAAPAGTAGDGTGTTATDGQDGIFRLTIKRGDVCRTVCETLAENGLITDAEALRKYLFEIGYASNLSTGEYDVPYGLSMEEVAKVLQEGPIE